MPDTVFFLHTLFHHYKTRQYFYVIKIVRKYFVMYGNFDSLVLKSN
jgi:hypothetical protein